MVRISSAAYFALVALGSSIVWLPAHVAGAQVESGERNRLIEEVVVTAQKREQDIQDVPISITAFSGDMAQELGFESIFEVQDQVPNFSLGGLGNTESTPIPYMNIRGIQFTDFAVINDSSVSLYLDEIYQAAPGAGASQMFDLERIEVLKGPQGSLFGRNTSAGLIQVVTKKPTDQPDGYLSLQYGRFDQRILEGAYGGPLSDNVRFRVAAKYNEDSGFRPDSPVNDLDNIGKTDVYAVRGTIEMDLTPELFMSVSAHMSESDGIFPGRYRYGTKDPNTGEECSRDRILSHECVTGVGFSIPKDDPTVHYEHEEAPSTYESAGGRVEFNLTRDWGEIVSITGYESFDFNFRQDTGLGPLSTFNVTGEYDSEVESFTQEVRAAGANESSEWVIGAYYYRDWRDLRNHVYFFYPTIISLRDRFGEIDTDSYAVFGQVSTDLSDTVTLAVGGRYTDETRNLKSIREGNDPSLFLSDEADFNNWTGDVTLNWHPSDSILGYVKFARGAKSGGYTTNGPTLAENGPADEEILDALEVGVKADWFSGRLRTNAAAFVYDFTGFQSTASQVLDDGSLASTFFNAGDAKIVGGELEITALPTENLEVILGIGLMDGELETAQDVVVNGTVVDGNDTPQTPSYNLNGLVRYNIPTSMGLFKLQADGRYQDDVFFGVDADPFEIQDAYGVMNFRIFWNSPSDAYQVSAFLENAFEEEYTTGGFYGAGAADTAWREVGSPRKWGVKFRYAMN